MGSSGSSQEGALDFRCAPLVLGALEFAAPLIRGGEGRGNPNAQISSANTVNISMYTLIFDVLLHFKQESF